MRAMLAVFFALMATAGAGKAAGYSEQYEQCTERADGIAAKLHDCESRESQRLDRVMNAEYQKLLKASPPPLAAAWRKAQRAWVLYRKAECDFASAFEQNGLGVGMWVDIACGCDMEMTISRTKAFKESVHFAVYHSPDFDTCTARAGARCVDDEAARLDRDLNAAYRNLMAAVAKSDDELWRKNYLDSLRKSERAWLAYRTTECALVNARLSGADKAKVAGDICRLSLLAARVRELRDELTNIDGR